MKTHRHTADTSTDRSYTGPVAKLQNRMAHGNITRHESCACGVVRKVNINGVHREIGIWS